MQSFDFKQTSQLLLTIAIPTYNRATFLDLCLTRIGEEIASLSIHQRKLVRVYISNNASTDNTNEVISQHQLMMDKWCEVVNSIENIGGERNVEQCYSSAKTPYVWVLGDDDVILPGGLKLVLDILETQKIDILYVNGYSYSDCYLDEPKRGRGKNGVVEYSNALDFVKRTHIMLTFITALILRTGVNIGAVGPVVNGSNLPQLSWVLQLVRDGKNFAIIKNRIFAAKIANSGEYGAINVFGSNLSNIANNILKSRPNLAKAIQNGTIVMWFPTYIMNLRKGDAEYWKEDVAIDIRRVFHGNWRYYVFLVPLILLPISLARLYFGLIRLARQALRYFLI